MSHIVHQSQQTALLGCLEFLVALFQGADEAQCAALLGQGAEELQSLCPPDFALAGPVSALCREVSGVDVVALCRNLQSEYVRLFISNPAGVPAPLYASCHQERPSALMSGPAREMAERLQAAGLEPDLPGNEPPDHLCVELGYLGHLLAEGFQAGGGGDWEPAQEFARGHLLPWVRRFAHRVSEASAPGLYLRAADLLVALAAFVASEER